MWPFTPRRTQRDFEDEIRSHLELEADNLVAEGVSAGEARSAARKRFGNVSASQERFYDASGFAWLRDFLKDVRYGARVLRKTPGFTAVAVMTIALGIGANAAVFSVVNGVLLEPLPYNDPARVVELWESLPGASRIMVAWPDYLDWRARTTSFDELALFSPFPSMSLVDGDVPEHIGAGNATATLFPLLGVRPVVGRLFTADEDRPGAGRTALLTEAFWRKRFGGDPRVVGRSLTLDGDPYTVIGVLPRTVGLGTVDLWVPIGLFTNDGDYTRGNHPGTIGMGRLKAGVTLAQMQSEMENVAAQIRAEHPDEAAGVGAGGAPLDELLVRDVLPALKMLAWAVALVLLLACVNVANLLLGRSSTRRKEVALRTAMGATRARLVRQLLAESIMLSLAGGALGVALAYAAVRAVLRLNPGGVPRLDAIGVDGKVLAFAAVVSIVTGLVFGIIPSGSASRVDVNDMLKETGRSSASASSVKLRGALMTFEVAIAMVLLVGAGLLVRSFIHLRGVNPGVDTRDVCVAWLSLPSKKYANDTAQGVATTEILRRIQAIPGVKGAALSTSLPLVATIQQRFTFEGHPRAKGSEPLVNVNYITPDYFTTMRMRVLRGRGIGSIDLPGTSLAAVISQRIASEYFPGEDPIGKHIIHGSSESSEPPFTIVGVVNDVQEYSLDELPIGMVYLSFAQSPQGAMALSVRSSLPLTQLLPAMRHAVAEFDRGLPLASASALADNIGKSIGRQRFTMFMLGVFAVVALVLAAVGVYGVIAFYVTQRSREIGIRMALGAARRDIAGLISRRVLLTTGTGIALGIAGAVAGSRLLTKLLFGVNPLDATTYLLGAATLIVAATVAAYVPTLRAIRVDPARTIRAE